MLTRRFRWLVCLVLVLPLCAVAQDEAIDEIVVEAARSDFALRQLPFAADVVTQDAIQDARPLLGLDESLLRVPGLLLQNRFNYAQDLRISMRGFGARSSFGIRGIRIIVDGIPETLVDGQGGIDGIDLGSVRRVEVLRGGASAIYGNAGGGVILIESERGADDATLTLGAAAGSDGYQRLSAKAKGVVSGVDYLVSANALDYDGFRDHNAAENRQLNLRLGWGEPGVADWIVSAHHTDQPTAQDPGGINRAQALADPRSARDANVNFDAGEALSQTRLGVRHRRQVGQAGELSLRAYGLQRRFDGRLPFGGGGAIDLNRDYLGAGVRYRHEFERGDRTHRLFVGLDADLQRDDRARFNNVAGVRGERTLDQRENVDAIGAYLQGEFELSEQWQLTVGLRSDRLRFDVNDRFDSDGDDSGERRFTALSPVLGLSWSPSEALTVYANASRSFESPTTTELANPDGSGGFNAGLEPQLARQAELGMRWSPTGDHQIGAAAFWIGLDDELIPFELDAFPGRDFFANAGSSERIGVELSWRARLAERWSLTTAYTWSDFKFLDYRTDGGAVLDGNTVPGTAEHVGFAELEYRAARGWFAALELSRVSAIVLNNANTERAEAYALLNLRGGLDWQGRGLRVSPYASITNLLDEDYTANARINAFGGRFFEPGPDRSVFVGVNVTWGGER